MYHPYIHQKIFEARARELERIAAEDRAGQTAEARGGAGRPAAATGRRARWRLRLIRRRVAIPRSVRSDADRMPGER